MLVNDAVIGKHNDAIWVRFAVDPLAVPLAKRLARSPIVTPNRITFVAGLCGLGAAAAFSFDLLRLGGALFIIRFFVDCLDGKVARLQGTSSVTGASLDLVADIGGIVICIGALSWRLLEEGVIDPAVPLALLAAVAFYNWVLAARKQHAKEVGAGDGGARGHFSSDLPVLRSWVRFSRRLDMSPIPWAIEAEILTLGLVPLLIGDHRWATYGLWLALAFYLVADVVNLRRLLRLTTAIDRGESGPTAEGPEGS